MEYGISKRNLNLALVLIMVFASGAWAVQIESFDDITTSGWTDSRGTTLMVQSTAPDEVQEGTGAMRIRFEDASEVTFTLIDSAYDLDVADQEVIPEIAFSTAQNFTPIQGKALKFWLWTDQVETSRVNELLLYDADGDLARSTGIMASQIGWQQVLIPMEVFVEDAGNVGAVDFSNIVIMQIHCSTYNIRTTAPLLPPNPPLPAVLFPVGNSIYIDDLQFVDWNGQIDLQWESFDNWQITEWYNWSPAFTFDKMDQNTDPNFVIEGTGSAQVKLEEDTTYNMYLASNLGMKTSSYGLNLEPYLDNAALTFNYKTADDFVWGDPNYPGSRVVQIIMYDVPRAGSPPQQGTAHLQVPPDLTPGWHKAVLPLSQVFYNFYGGATDFDWQHVFFMMIWLSDYETGGNSIYIDDLRLTTNWESEWPVLQTTEANIIDADYMSSDIEFVLNGDPNDWATLNSETVSIDLQAIGANGNLSANYRLAWDENYLYAMIEEQPGDELASEPADRSQMKDFLGFFDQINLFFDFDNDGWVGWESYGGDLFAEFGFSSASQDDLFVAHGPNGLMYVDLEDSDNTGIATSGTLGNRSIEAKISWSDLADEMQSGSHPIGGLLNAIKPGYTFGCDPQLMDLELDEEGPYDETKGAAWLTGGASPTGFDTDSIDIQLIYTGTCAELQSKGWAMDADLVADCVVDINDAKFQANRWLDTNCAASSDCDGADLNIDDTVNLSDFALIGLKWLDCNDPADTNCWL